MKKVENGELVYVDLGQHQGKCVQSGIRPCLVVGSYYASDWNTIWMCWETKVGRYWILLF